MNPKSYSLWKKETENKVGLELGANSSDYLSHKDITIFKCFLLFAVSVTYLADTAPENGGSGKRSVVVENIVSVSKGRI